MNLKKSVRAVRGASWLVWGWLVWGMFLALLVVAGCGSNSSSASTSSSSSVGPFEVEVNVSQTTVLDRSVLLSPQVSFEVKNALGEVGFAVRSEPAVDWFVAENDVLSFEGQKRADYDADALADVEDGGDGKPIKLTIVATDAGRSENNAATVDVTVLVVLRDFSAAVFPSTVYVRDGDDVLAEYVLFAPSGARGAVSYEVVRTSPEVDWFVLDADGLLRFADGQRACYDNDPKTPENPCPLHGLETDEGEGKPVVLTVRATDAGPPARQAAVELTVNVLPPPFELRASPSVVTIESGSNRLNGANRIEVVLDNPQYLLGDASYSVSTDLGEGWFAIRTDEDDARNGVLSLARVLEHGALSDLPTTDAGRLLQVQVRLEDRGRTMAASAEQLVDVVVTLRPQISPLWLDPSAVRSEVTHYTDAMTPEIRFTPNALGTMGYTMTVSPSTASGWFALQKEGENGVLKFATGQTADYDLASISPTPGVRTVTVTVTGTDEGRSVNKVASSSITLEVHLPVVDLTLSPSEVEVQSGAATLPLIEVSGKNVSGRAHYAIAEVRPAVDWFAIDAATTVLSLTRPTNYLDPALADLEDENGKTIEVDIELTALDRSAEQQVVKTLAVRVRPTDTFSIFVDNDRARVEHESAELSSSIQFSVQGSTNGETKYMLTTTPAVSWISVGEDDGVLSLSSAANYSDLGSLPSLNGIKEVVVTVTAADDSNTSSTNVIIEVVRPAGAFRLRADVSEASVRDGDVTLSPAAGLSVENGAGTITVAQASPAGALSWFAVTDNALTLSSAADYGTDAGDVLESVADFGQGKPVLVTLSVIDDDSGAIAQTTVQVSVLPPSLDVKIKGTASIEHGTRAVDTGLTVEVDNSVGVLNYEVVTDPTTDWLGVKSSTGSIYVRADRAIDWNALDVELASDGSKPLSVHVRVTDSGRTGEDAADSLPVTLNVRPAPFAIGASRASASVEDGASDQSTTVFFYSEANLASVTYHIAGTSPAGLEDWFAVVDDGNDGGDLHLAADQNASYADAALTDAVDSGQGKPIYVSVRGCDGLPACDNSSYKAAFASVIIHVRSPAFDLQVSPTETGLREQGTSLETNIVFTPIGAVGSVKYSIITSPSVDWFEVVNNKLALVYATEVRSETIGADTIQVYVAARDSGRPSLDPGSLIKAEVITVRIIPAYTIRIELNSTRAEFFEKGGQLNPAIKYEVQGVPESTGVNVRVRGDVQLCHAMGECEFGFYLVENDRLPHLAVVREGQLFVRLEDANFWQTKRYYSDRGDDQALPLYFEIILHYTDEGVYRLKARRELLLTMKNIPNDERITEFEGDDLIIPEGDADDLFFFPISTRLDVESTVSWLGEFEVDDPRFRVRDVNFIYRGFGNQIDAGDYGVHDEPHVDHLGYSAFRPCRTGASSGECRKLDSVPDYQLDSGKLEETVTISATGPTAIFNLRLSDLRLALQPGEILEVGGEPITVSVIATLLDSEPGFDRATAEFTIRVIERQDGTEEHPFIVDSADELRSISSQFRSDYTEAYCNILPTCVDGNLARFQTRVSHYLQTADIDLASDFQHPIGVLSDSSAIVFHGNYNGAGYQIFGLETESAGGLFHLVGTAAVIEDVHLREVAVNGYVAGGLINEVESFYDPLQRRRYQSRRSNALTLPYYDFYFGSLWNQFEFPGRRSRWPEVLSSSVSGSVSGIKAAGGLVGELNEGLVQGSYSTATVGASSSAGGLAGSIHFFGRIYDSFAAGDVRGGQYVGGLMGWSTSSVIRRSFAAGVLSALDGANPDLGAVVGMVYKDENVRIRDSYGLGSPTLVGKTLFYGDTGVNTLERVYGSSDGIAAWTCSDAPLLWYSDTLGVNHGTCADYTSGGGQEADFPWDFGTASEYPVLNYNVLTPAEIRCVAFSETSLEDCLSP